MDNLKKYEDRINPLQKSSMDLFPPALDEVITEIDRAVVQFAASETDEKATASILAKTDKSQHTQFILFTLESTFFALSLTSALEIGHRPEIVPLPNLPDWILGISNIRGEIISFVNLKAFFGIPSSGTKGERRFVILYNQDMKVGIVVDKTPGILSIDKINMDIQDSPYRQREFVKYIAGVTISEDNIINILDTDRLISSLGIADWEAD